MKTNTAPAIAARPVTHDLVPVLKEQLPPIIKSAESIEIVDEASKTKATQLLSILNARNDKVVAEKKTITDPANAILKRERARWKPIETMLSQGIDVLRTKLSRYQTEQKRIADEEAEKIAARVAPGRGNLSSEKAVEKIAAIATPSKVTVTDAGSVKFRTVPKFEVMDLTLLPIEYHLANETAIRAAMREGTQLPGVRYYEEEEPINSRG